MSAVQELKSILSRLEALTGVSSGGSTATGGNYPPLTEFRHVVEEFKAASGSVAEAQLKDVTEIVLKAFDQMETVVQFSTQMKKPTADQFKQVQKAIVDGVNKITKLMTNQTIQPHCKVVLDGINCVFWVLSDTPNFVFEGAIEPAEYNGLKVKQQKVAENSKWYDLLIKSLKTLQVYAQQNFKMGLDWNPKGTRTFEELLGAVKGEKVAAPAHGVPPPPPGVPPPPPPVSALPPASSGGTDKAALFAQLNVGEDITKMLRKVDKEALKREKETAAPVQKKQQQVQHQAQHVEAKPPRRYFKENWFVENYVNERLIEFTDADVDMKQSIFIDNCNNCGIIVKSKVKSIFLQKCSKIQLVFEQTVSGIELVGSKRCEVTCLNSCPSFMVDNSESIHLTFNQSKVCDIVSSKTMDLNVTYLQADGDLAKDTNIPEQFLTVWDNDNQRFVTKPLENFFG